MEYTLLSNNNGIITTRTPTVFNGELLFTFKNAPQGATAVFTNKNNRELYRVLTDSSCSVPETFIGEGEIAVCVVSSQNGAVRKWSCEAVCIAKVESSYLIFPCDMNLPCRVVQLEVENEELKEKQKGFETELVELKQKLSKLLEGYDIA